MGKSFQQTITTNRMGYYHQQSIFFQMNYTDPCTFALDTDAKIREIMDLPAEIYDIPEIANQKEFNMDEYLSADYDY